MTRHDIRTGAYFPPDWRCDVECTIANRNAASTYDMTAEQALKLALQLVTAARLALNMRADYEIDYLRDVLAGRAVTVSAADYEEPEQ